MLSLKKNVKDFCRLAKMQTANTLKFQLIITSLADSLLLNLLSLKETIVRSLDAWCRVVWPATCRKKILKHLHQPWETLWLLLQPKAQAMKNLCQDLVILSWLKVSQKWHKTSLHGRRQTHLICSTSSGSRQVRASTMRDWASSATSSLSTTLRGTGHWPPKTNFSTIWKPTAKRKTSMSIKWSLWPSLWISKSTTTKTNSIRFCRSCPFSRKMFSYPTVSWIRNCNRRSKSLTRFWNHLSQLDHQSTKTKICGFWSQQDSTEELEFTFSIH